jgi:hypothetical protein
MDASRVHKRISVESNNPLLNSDILQNVLSYVGPGHCLFVALVSTWWKKVYTALEPQQQTLYNKIINCGPEV